MEKQEAATFLGVSVRTLERLSATGKLTKGRALKKTRPVVVYDQKELERLKKELESARPVEVFGRPNTPKPTDAIGFRLDPFYIKRLIEEGEKHGFSAAEYARRLVIRGIEMPVKEGASADVAALRQALTDMFYLILVSKLGASEAEASEIVRSLSGGE
jgi:hypothetical protein